VGLECGWSCTSIVIFHKMLPEAAKTLIHSQAVQFDTTWKSLRLVCVHIPMILVLNGAQAIFWSLDIHSSLRSSFRKARPI
jgi:hypothetical protein